MNAGVGRLDSPKYSRRTPSIDIASSPSSRIPVYGTRAREAAYGVRASVSIEFMNVNRGARAPAGSAIVCRTGPAHDPTGEEGDVREMTESTWRGKVGGMSE